MVLQHLTIGKPPPIVPQYLNDTSNIEVVDELLTTHSSMIEDLRRKLTKAQVSMK